MLIAGRCSRFGLPRCRSIFHCGLVPDLFTIAFSQFASKLAVMTGKTKMVPLKVNSDDGSPLKRVVRVLTSYGDVVCALWIGLWHGGDGCAKHHDANYPATEECAGAAS